MTTVIRNQRHVAQYMTSWHKAEVEDTSKFYSLRTTLYDNLIKESLIKHSMKLVTWSKNVIGLCQELNFN